MRRILLILTVGALMAAMMVSAGPAKAVSNGNTSGFDNSFGVVQSDNHFFGFGNNNNDCNGLDNFGSNEIAGIDFGSNDLFGNNNDCNGNDLFGDNNHLFGDNNHLFGDNNHLFGNSID